MLHTTRGWCLRREGRKLPMQKQQLTSCSLSHSTRGGEGRGGRPRVDKHTHHYTHTRARDDQRKFLGRNTVFLSFSILDSALDSSPRLRNLDQRPTGWGSHIPDALPSVISFHCCANSLKPPSPAMLASTTSLGSL